MKLRSQSGSAIIIVLIAIALFAALAYAFMYGSRSSISMLESEQASTNTTRSRDCQNAINLATKRLEARGCGSLISAEADGSNLNDGAPADGSCSIYHPNGGGVKSACFTPPAPCDLTALTTIGEKGCGVVYAGVYSGKRYYTTESNSGTATFNNGTGTDTPPATTINNGASNTTALVNAANAETPYAAAEMCHVRGAEWYLPSLLELWMVLYANKAAIDNFPTTPQANYWSSYTTSATTAQAMDFSSGSLPSSTKNNVFNVRCVRND